MHAGELNDPTVKVEKLEYNEITFSFKKYVISSGDIIFYITTNIPEAKSFFISKIQPKGWQILYHNLLGNEILKYEPIIDRHLAKYSY